MKRFRDTDYYVSENGDVFRKWKHKITQNKPQMVRRYRDGKPIKDKYIGVYIYQKGKGTFFLIHRLVAEVYLPNPDNLPEVDHLDTNRFNNHYTNLEWVSNPENMKRALENNIFVKGENTKQSKLTNDDVRYIRKNYIKGCKEYGSLALAKKFKISQSQISRIVNNTSWKNSN